MSEHDKTVRVFTGSKVEANYVKSLLEEGGIGAMIRNTLEESTIAGWVSGAQEDACLVFVAEHDKAKAEELIAELSEGDQ
jgi:hypothetical protein